MGFGGGGWSWNGTTGPPENSFFCMQKKLRTQFFLQAGLRLGPWPLACFALAWPWTLAFGLGWRDGGWGLGEGGGHGTGRRRPPENSFFCMQKKLRTQFFLHAKKMRKVEYLSSTSARCRQSLIPAAVVLTLSINVTSLLFSCG